MNAMPTPWIGLLCLLITVSAYAQSETQPSSFDTSRMFLPPVFQSAVPVADFDKETTGNFLQYGIMTSAAYNDNVLPEQSVKAVPDSTYSMRPTITFDQRGERFTQQLMYSPGFTVYQKTSSLNDFEQHLTENLQGHLSENMTLNVEEHLDKSSNAFSQQAGDSQSGLPPEPISGTVAPYADQFLNTVSLGWRYQYGEDSLVGAASGYTVQHYLHPDQAEGLANNSTLGASGFYLHRFAGRHYLGALYQFTELAVTPDNTPDLHIRLNAVAGSYTLYISRSMQISVAAGPQHLQLEGSQYPQYESWQPWVQADLTWHSDRTALTGTFLKTATTGGGLEGIFKTETIGLTGRWQPALKWTLSASGGYLANSPETSFLTSFGGHGYSFSALAMRRLSEHWDIQFQYDRLYQRSPGVLAIANDPLSNREAVSLSYSIKRRLAQ